MVKIGVPGAIALVFVGCCINVVFLELIIKEVPSSGHIITLAQFLFIASASGIFVTRCGLRKRHIPIQRYFILVAFFFIVNILNNYSYSFNIPLPLHMIFRSGSLIANMILGIILLKKSYQIWKYVGVTLITIGITMATLASAYQIDMNGIGDGKSYAGDNGGILHTVQMVIGVSLLVVALFATASMGIYQETLYKSHGKHPKEAMFYMHAFPLPGFIIFASDIWSKMVLFSASEPISLGLFHLPKLWFYIIGNCVSQYICIQGVFTLTTECSSLTVTLVLTLRKFLSLLFSIFYFQNPFTTYHWVATVMVFGGTALFTGVFQSLLKWLGLIADSEQQKGEEPGKEGVVVQSDKKRD